MTKRRLKPLVLAPLAALGLITLLVTEAPGATRNQPPDEAKILFEQPVTASAQAIVLNGAIQLARGAVGKGELAGAQSVAIASNASTGRDGTSRGWLVSLIVAGRGREVSIQDGRVARIVDAPARSIAGLPDGIDSDIAASAAATVAGFGPGDAKSPGTQFSFRSVDGRPSVAVLGSHNGRAARIEVDRATGRIWDRRELAPSGLGGVLSSADEGATWSASSLRGMVFAIAAAGGGAFAIREDAGGLSLNRTDDGSTWVPVAALPAQAGTHAFAMIAELGALIVGTSNGLWRSTDGGQTWQKDPGLDGPVQYLAPLGATGGVAADVTTGPQSGVYSSGNAGAWTRAGAAERLNPLSGGRVALLGGTPATATILDASTITSMPVPPGTLRIADLGDSMLAVSQAGVSWSTDQGAHWHLGLAVSVAAVEALGRNRAVAGGFGSGMFTTVDGGRTWSTAVRRPSELIAGSNEVYAIRALANGTVIAVNGGTLTWQGF